MDACPLLITSIVAVKPEDQGTFLQDFLGLSGYLCSIGGFYSNTALLRTRNAQNHNEAQRLALVAGGADQLTRREQANSLNDAVLPARTHPSAARLVRLCSLVLSGSFEGVVIMVLSFVFILTTYQDINGQEEPSILCRAK